MVVNMPSKEEIALVLARGDPKQKKEFIKKLQECESLKCACLLCVVEQTPPCTYGVHLENIICKLGKYEKLNASIAVGDLKKNNKNYEVKISLGGVSRNKFNFVQIRPIHACEYILVSYYLNKENAYTDDPGELYIFSVAANKMKDILLKHGSYAHGTKDKLGVITRDDLVSPNNDKEYAIRPAYGSELWNELQEFRIQESDLYEL